MKRITMISVFVATVLSACGKDKKSDQNEDLSSQSLGITDQQTIIDASHKETWIFVDLDQDLQIVDESAGWDIALQRFKVKLNPISEITQAVVTKIDGLLAEQSQAPQGPYQTDRIQEGQKIEDGLAFVGQDPWYDYNFQTHILTPKSRVYVVRTSQDQFIGLSFTKYYDAAGTPGWITLEWKPLAKPESEIEITQ